MPLQPGVGVSRVALDNLRRKGFGRLLIGGQAVAFEDVDAADAEGPDRCCASSSIASRWRPMRARASPTRGNRLCRGRRRGVGAATAWMRERRFDTCSPSASSAAPAALPYEDPQPRLFSFNNPFGACPTCHGFGNIIELDLELVVPDQAKSINQGAIEPWTKPHYRSQLAELKRAAKASGVRLDVPWRDLTPEEIAFVMDGDGEDFEGVRGFFRWLERKKYKVHVRVFLSRYRGYLTCPDCERHAAAPRSARRAGRRRDDRQGLVSHGSRGRAVLCRSCS